MSINVGAIDVSLKAAGIPIISVRDTDGTLQGVEVEFDLSATPSQKTTAASIVASFVDPSIVDATNLSDIQTRWKASALHGQSPQQIFTTLQGQIDGWSTLAQAKSDLRVWLPLLTAALAWTIFKDQQR